MPKKRAKLGKAVRTAARRIRGVGGRVATTVADTPELIVLQRDERALRTEIDAGMRNLGKRVLSLHKRSPGRSPFNRFRTITKEIEILADLEERLRSNRTRLRKLHESHEHRRP